MAIKPKARGAKKNPTSKENKEVQKTQGEQFIETARELGVDESGKKFEKTFDRIAKQKSQS